MPAIFSPCAGAVVVPNVECKDTYLLTISVGSTSPISAIVTGMTLEMSGNYQFLHTLNDLVYFYSFGDRVGTLVLTGIGFVKPCNGGATGAILDIYDYYMQRRAVKSEGQAMRIVLSAPDNKDVRLWGFLTGMRIDVNDSQMGVIGYWTMRFEVLPQKET
jgi:hypothetical protein